MASHFRNIFVVTLILIIELTLHDLKAQSFQFKTFDSNVGLPQNFVYCVAQDQCGFIWMGTGEGLVKYNGLNFESFNGTDYLSDDFITALFVAPDGKLWIGHNNGDLT
jgi:ligand-binding sensor domain-containing protein